MKAIAYHRYGPPDVLACEEIEKPRPADDEVLIRVRATSVNPLDWHFMRGMPYIGRLITGLRRPKLTRPGVDVAGRVEAVGKNVTTLGPGDAVFGTCRGALADYVCAPQSAVIRKPVNMTFEQAASAPVAAVTALQALRDKGRVRPGQRVLINGAAGGVGTFAVQIAKILGAHVTGTCSTRNVEMVRAIGADRVIDYMHEDFTRSSERYDLVLDMVGNRPVAACSEILTRSGLCIAIGGPNGRWLGPFAYMIKAYVFSKLVNANVIAFAARADRDDLTTIRDLMESGKLRPVIDRRFDLDEFQEAIRYVEQGHIRGKVVIST